MGSESHVTLDSHTVPRFYLKQWSADGISLCCYRTIRKHSKQSKWKMQNLKSASVVRGFYTTKPGNCYDDSIERYLGEHESAASGVIKKIAEGGQADDADVAQLVDFAIVQWARSPLHLANLNKVLLSSFESTSEEAVRCIMEAAATEGSESKISSKEPLSANPYPEVPLHINFDNEAGAVITTFSAGQQSALYAMGRSEQGAAREVLRSYSWLLLECPPGIFLPTSDNPFVSAKFSYKDGYRLDCGIAEPNVLLFMPITPRHLLVAKSRWETVNRDLLVDFASRDRIIHAIVNNSHLYVYCFEECGYVESIRESRVDLSYFKEYEAAMKSWMGT